MISEAKAFWDSIAGKVKSLIHKETENVLRVQRYDVTTAPNGTVIGVTQPFGGNEIFIPYSSEVSGASVGDTVLVVWWGSMSNARAYYYAYGYDGSGLVTSVNGKTGDVKTYCNVSSVDQLIAFAQSSGDRIPFFFSATSTFAQTLGGESQVAFGFARLYSTTYVEYFMEQLNRRPVRGYITLADSGVHAKTIAYDTDIPSASDTAPSADTDGGAAGTATTWSRSDHQHKLNVATSGTPAALGTASNGTATTYARSDHVHAKTTYGNQTNYTSGTRDMNTFTTAGLYFFSNGCTLSNQPGSATNGWLLVLKTTTTTYKQLWFRFGSNPTTHRQIYERIYASSAWGAWVQIAPNMSWKKLWTNASPTSNFAAQTVALTLTDYDAVIVMFKNDTGTDADSFALGFKSAESTMLSFYNYRNRRTFTMTDTGVTFKAGYNASQTGNLASNNGAAIPNVIYGIRGVE